LPFSDAEVLDAGLLFPTTNSFFNTPS
jgi:hypothetical protein